MVDRIRLENTLELETATGEVFRIRPVQGGRGLAVLPVRRSSQASSGRPGRPPRASTLELRARLRKDAHAKRVGPAAQYAQWLLARDPELKPATARQTVYRERRAVLEEHPGAEAPDGDGRAGSHTPEVLTRLRKRLRQDHASGGLQAPKQYVDWVLKQDQDMGLKQARSMVYRERRTLA